MVKPCPSLARFLPSFYFISFFRHAAAFVSAVTNGTEQTKLKKGQWPLQGVFSALKPAACELLLPPLPHLACAAVEAPACGKQGKAVAR